MAAPAKAKGKEVVVEEKGEEEEEKEVKDEEQGIKADELARRMERLDILERWEVAAEALRREDAAAAREGVGRRVLPAFGGLMPPGGIWWDAAARAATMPPSPPAMRRHGGLPRDHLGRGYFHGARPVVASMPLSLPPRSEPREITRLIVSLATEEQMVLHTLFQGPPSAAKVLADAIVSNAGDIMDSSIGQHLLSSVLNNCSNALREAIVAGITRDRHRFSRICAERSVDVVRMIRSCVSRKSCQIVGDAIMPWVAPSRMQSLLNDSDRLRVVQACVQRFPPDIAKFLFDAVTGDCVEIACHPGGLLLLQNCLYHMAWEEKDNIFTELSYSSVRLAQDRNGNYIIQDVLEAKQEFHLDIIASCFRGCYVDLARQKYSSRVVEKCLEVFDCAKQYSIVAELMLDPDQFRYLVTDDFANYVISAALQTCVDPLLHMLATAILSLQNRVNRRHPHCLKIFNLLSQLGYIE